jgi:hypothetical protein
MNLFFFFFLFCLVMEYHLKKKMTGNCIIARSLRFGLGKYEAQTTFISLYYLPGAVITML